MSGQEEITYSVYYSPLDTSLMGRLWIAARDGGIFLLDFSETEEEFIKNLEEILKQIPEVPEIRLDPTNLSIYLETLLNFFNDKIPIPKDLPIGIDFLTDFQRQILELIQEIPFGAVTTYGDIAKQLKNENAARAVGQVLRRNPLPIIIPCHRIISADGTVGGYGGILGSERKIALLKHEGVILT
jgi:methylated-DNA-[protein]-cysteine S-methyltransferase